jgi:hypothetical protein
MIATNQRRGFKQSNWKKNILPSELNLKDLQNHINKILDEYVVDHAKHQVCICGQFVKNLKKRINLIHLYSPHVFSGSMHRSN